ncbi:MAG: glucoamylase family protein [Gammaproteobacteria bacterium]
MSPRVAKPRAQARSSDALSPAELAGLPDDELIDRIQRQTFGYFWDGAHPGSGLAYDRLNNRSGAADDKVVTGGSGFGVMALIVGVERGWVTREAALNRLGSMLELLIRATIYHGAFTHFLNGVTAATIPFWRKDDAADLVETSFLCMGLLCARQYFNRDTPAENLARSQISLLWEDVEWDWYTRDGRKALYWHWSPNNGWAMNHPIRGWNECLVTYLLAVASPRYGVDPAVYHEGFASGRGFANGNRYYDIELPLGMPYGGPLFFTHYSFCGLDPRGLEDRYADYWDLNSRHVQINYAHCVANPNNFKGYGANCWGLTASDDWSGYSPHAPDLDNGTITPTAALASLPYAPKESLRAARYFLREHGEKVWGRYGFVDAFCEDKNWFASHYLAIDQGPIVVMMENHRTGLLWNLFMSVPEVQNGLRLLGFTSPHLREPPDAGSGG